MFFVTGVNPYTRRRATEVASTIEEANFLKNFLNHYGISEVYITEKPPLKWRITEWLRSFL